MIPTKNVSKLRMDKILMESSYVVALQRIVSLLNVVGKLKNPVP